MKHYKSVRNDTSGAVAILLALVILPVLGVVAFNVDLNRKSKTINHLQSAMDAAALAGAKELANSSNSLSDIRSNTIRYFFANIQTSAGDLDCNDPSVEIDADEYTVSVSGNCMIKSIFGDTFWSSELSVGNMSQAVVSVTHLDLAMMLDVSGSMAGSKLEALKVAAKEAADILVTPQTGERVRVSFATYSNSVNVKDFAMSVVNLAQLSNELQRTDSNGNMVFHLGDDICVEERPGVARYRDNEPMGASTRFPLLSTTNCPPSSILPLTADLDRFNQGIDTLNANSGTSGHQGIAWSWYLLSPRWSSVWPSESTPLPYGSDRMLKAVIIMTDGEFNTSHSGQSSPAQAVQLCDNIRDEDVIVFTVAFELNDTSAENTLRDCAGDASRFFQADNSQELIAAYRNIASVLSNLRLSE